ncbi:hypothetical protein KUV50_07570 [Membranicola marinus]|uniref:Peptidoglycan-binding protein LysM n=1 Tax=Membranihabitans marinus TaxID=1227546 RepID=A0A953HLR1_9BACT|nr:hypothetical protein [Membranihabitans marinus]MBY5957982.1 hypothetical protein [Membranihabitans marinus]
MKKSIIITALAFAAIVFTTNQATAQNATAQRTSATTQVNINLSDVISIDPGSVADGSTVEFNYNTAADYNSTQTKKVPKSLIVTSTKSFDVNVKANGANFEKGSDFIPVDVLTIKPVTGGTTTMTGTPSNVVLSTSDQKLISGADLGSSLVLDLEYVIPQAKSSSSDILGKPAGTYTQKVTYTATAL